MHHGTQPCKPTDTYNTYKQKWTQNYLSKNNIRKFQQNRFSTTFECSIAKQTSMITL